MGEIAFIGTEQAKLVRRLEALLDRAKAGNLKVVIAAHMDENGDIGFTHCGALSAAKDDVTEYAKIVGMISTLHHDVNASMYNMLMSESEDV